MLTKPAVVIAAVAMASLSCAAAFGAEATAPLSRADVKAETRAAAKAGKLVPAGEGPQFPVSGKSNTTRAERKTDTRAAAKAHQIMPAGDADIAMQDRAARAQPTAVNRADRKSDTRWLQQSRKLVPAGEGPDAPKK